MPNELDLKKLQLIREVHGETGALIADIHDALPPVMAHRWLDYDYWTHVGYIEKLRKVLQNGRPSVRRPVGHITDLIRRLTVWRDRRQSITDDLGRDGKPLPNTELDQAISYLEEYRELMAAGVTKERTDG